MRVTKRSDVSNQVTAPLNQQYLAKKKYVWELCNGASTELLFAQIKKDTREFEMGHVELKDKIV